MAKKIVLLTGASSGIGKATALKLLADGHMVYGAARRLERMKEIENAGGQALEMDVTIPDQVEDVVNHILQKEGRIDVLINNAGYGLYGAVEDVSIEDAQRQFEVNIFGLARVTKAVLKGMRERRSGTILNISSMGGKMYTPLGAWYHATKHALEGWSDCLRLELKDFNVNVVIIEPGIIRSEFGDHVEDSILKYSGNGPYSELATLVSKATSEIMSDEGKTSPPGVIADLIFRVVKTEKPNTRYARGKLARPMLFLRNWISDALYDKVVMSQVNRLKSKR